MKNTSAAKLIALCFFATATFGQSLMAQDDEDKKETIAIRYLLGYGNFPNGELAAFAPELGSMNGHHFTFGINGIGYQNKLMLGYTVLGALGNPQENSNKEIHSNSFSFTLEGGYMLLDQKQTKLYPSLGLGASFLNTFINEDGDLDLQDVQNDYGREISMYRLGFTLDFAVNFDYLPKWKFQETNEKYTSFLLGLRAGYHYNFAGDNWRYSGGEINGAPSYGLQGFYVQLAIGAASTNKLQ